MLGASGSRKTAIAEHIPGILPPMTFGEAVETAEICIHIGQNLCVRLDKVKHFQEVRTILLQS
jgi:predicted ATPase with chaperone activity